MAFTWWQWREGTAAAIASVAIDLARLWDTMFQLPPCEFRQATLDSTIENVRKLEPEAVGALLGDITRSLDRSQDVQAT